MTNNIQLYKLSSTTKQNWAAVRGWTSNEYRHSSKPCSLVAIFVDTFFMDINDRHKSFYFVAAIVGLILLMLEIEIYQKTIIPLKIPFAVTLVVAVIGFFIIQRDYRRTYQNKRFFFPFAQRLISFGFTACYLFMAANYYLADNKTETRSVSILTKHTIGTGSKQQPAIEIDYEGTEKQLVFYSGQQQQVSVSKEVVLTIKKGLFGFDTFTDITLK